MKNVNEIINTLVETAKTFEIESTHTFIRKEIGDFDVEIDITIRKHKDDPYSVINTIPQPNFNDILPKGNREPL